MIVVLNIRNHKLNLKIDLSALYLRVGLIERFFGIKGNI
jgi:hypothetical protein